MFILIDNFIPILDRYKQHRAEKRGDPLAQSFLHTVNVEWDHYKGDIFFRDTLSVVLMCRI